MIHTPFTPQASSPRVDSSGWLHGVADLRHRVSPNCDARPANTAVELLVIHHISLPPAQFGGTHIADFFCNQLDDTAHPYFASLLDVRVSAHFLIARDGSITQFVPCGLRAWHAGVSAFRGRTACNDFSLGIELEGTGDLPYTAAQYQQLSALTRLLCQHYPLRWIAGHSDIAPGRKSDPGASFDWWRYQQSCHLPNEYFPFCQSAT